LTPTSCSTIPAGKELGFLPGTLEEKLNPWMQPIHDALELLSDLNMGLCACQMPQSAHKSRGLRL
jgi:predicted ribonuclease YlaK